MNFDIRDAVYNGDLEKLKTLDFTEPCIDDDNDTAIEIAAYFGHLNIVKYLLEHYSKLFESSWIFSALECACENGKINVVDYLLKTHSYCLYHRNGRLKNPEFFYIAVRDGQIKTVEFLIDKYESVFHFNLNRAIGISKKNDNMFEFFKNKK